MFANAYLIFIAGLAAVAQPPYVERGLATFEKTAEKFELTAKPENPKPLDLNAGNLVLLRRDRISSALLDQLIVAYARNGGANLAEKGEAAFRIARHCYLQNRGKQSLEWIGKIPSESASAEWTAKGNYLRGILFIDEGKRPEARRAFENSAHAAPESPTATQAQIAMARLDFDAGNYTQAQKMYEAARDNQADSDSTGDELAWTLLKLSRPNLAALELDLLFALQPENPRLPDAGQLLAQLYRDEGHMLEAVNLLEQLAVRFQFEQEGAARALSLFDKKEDEILLEYNPKLWSAPARAVLPPIVRSLMYDDPTTREYLTQLEELAQDREELIRGASVIESAASNSAGNGATVESVVLLEWANDLERQKLALPEPSTELQKELEARAGKIQALKSETENSIRSLSEIDAHIWIHWKLLGGQREKLALGIKQSVRAEIANSVNRMQQIERLQLQNDALQLRLRKSAALRERERLRALRPANSATDSWYARLDGALERTGKKEAQRMAQIHAALPAMELQRKNQLRRLDEARDRVLTLARSDLHRILKREEETLARATSSYRSSIADLRYRIFRATENEIEQVQARSAHERDEVDARYAPLAEKRSRPLPVAPLQSAHPEIQERIADGKAFARAAQIHVTEIRNQIQSDVDYDLKRYDRYAKWVEASMASTRERRREEAIVAYLDEQTPYALLRLAQLQFDRAQAVARSGEGHVPEYHLAVKPLEKIRTDHPSFRFRANALYLLGYTLLTSGEKARSAAVFQQLVDEFPKSPLLPEVQLRIGEYYFSEKQFARAIPHYQAVLSFGFNYFYDKALYKLAWSNYLLGKYDSAIAHFLILLDYSEELPPDQRTRLVDFEDEATEFLAFSILRAGGAANAERIFTKVGWKPHAREILERMARIAEDRGEHNDARQAYELAISKYPDTPALPDLVEGKLRALEKLNRPAVSDKERALAMFRENGTWRNKNASNEKALAAADHLLERITYSLATQYDLWAKGVASGTQRKRAQELYRETDRKYPLTASAYEARYRLAEMNFEEGQYREAILKYDGVVRSDRFSAHFSDSLYGIVASREKILAASAKSASDENAVQLVQSISNFALRSPSDPRVPQALYRKAEVQDGMKDGPHARETYLEVARRYPATDWGRQAPVAAINSFVAEGKWNEAATLARQVEKERIDLPADMRARIAALEESARFKHAAELDRNGQPNQAIAAYFQFQKDFASSPLAPKALFNAFAIGKREMNVEPATQALSLLLIQYPKSPEASHAHLERARLLDAAFDIEPAIAEYRLVLAASPSSEDASSARKNLMHILPVSSAPKPWVEISELSKHFPAAEQGEALLLATQGAWDRSETEAALDIWKSLAERTDIPMLMRARAATLRSRLLWEQGKTREGQAWDIKAGEILKWLKKDQKPEIQTTWAEAGAFRMTHRRSAIEAFRIKSDNAALLTKTFKQKAGQVAAFERDVLALLEQRSLRASAYALSLLGQVYKDFASELSSLSPPAKMSVAEQQEFKQGIEKLNAPLQGKSAQAFEKSYSLLRDARLPENYLPSMTTEPERVGTPLWSGLTLPDPPAFHSDTPMSPATSGLRGLTLFASGAPAPDLSLWKKEDRKRAEASFAKELYEHPGSKSAIYNLAIVQMYDGNHDDMERSLANLKGKISVEQEIDLEATHFLLKQAPLKALETLKKLPEGTEVSGHTRHVWVLSLLQTGNAEAAERMARSWIASTPPSTLSYRTFAAVLRETGRREFARLVLERALEMGAGQADVLGELALVYSEPRNSLLRSSFLKDAAMRSGRPEFRSNWATLAWQVRDYDTACAEWRVIGATAGDTPSFIRKNLDLCKPLPEQKDTEKTP